MLMGYGFLSVSGASDNLGLWNARFLAISSMFFPTPIQFTSFYIPTSPCFFSAENEHGQASAVIKSFQDRCKRHFHHPFYVAASPRFVFGIYRKAECPIGCLSQQDNRNAKQNCVQRCVLLRHRINFAAKI